MLAQLEATPNTDTVRGKAGYLLAFVALAHFVYPITLDPGGTVALVLYNVLYSGMFIVGIIMARDSRRHLLVTLVTAAVYLAFSVWYSLDPASTWRIMMTYVALVPFQATILLILLRYVFRARRITRDVLYAGITVYLLLAVIFVPLYGLLNTQIPGAFVDNGTGAAVSWQQLIYYSLTTLTTTGYGDVLPVSPWARSLANAEMVIGVLYIAILMARLVSLYSHEE